MTGPAPILVKLDDAARMVGVSTATLSRAIHTTDPASYPPPLKAKRTPKGFRIKVRDLEAWADSLPDV